MKCLEIGDVRALVQRHGLEAFFADLMEVIKEDFATWEDFDKRPRIGYFHANGVVELMPVANKDLFAFKYVNGHPVNTQKGKLCVLAYGALFRMDDGYPILLSEMTVLTALRTAAVAAVSSEYLARSESECVGMIGCGAQSEFLVLAHQLALKSLKRVCFFDIDASAMRRFERNMRGRGLELVAGASAREVAEASDVLIVATATQERVKVVEDAWVKPGTHIVGVGGDTSGKTELDAAILERAKVVVEYFPQTAVEGEIQIWDEAKQKERVFAELWELVLGLKEGRSDATDVSVFDAVGFALEDFSILRLCERLAREYGLGKELDFIPQMENPKALFDVLGEV